MSRYLIKENIKFRFFPIQKLIFLYFLGKLLLKEAEHVYPFSVSLPDNLPSTFEEEYGRVQYTAKVVINIPWDIKKGKEIAFEVISTLNLNDEPTLAVSIS